MEVQRICQYCAGQFTAQKTTTRYCSHKCNQRAYKAIAKGVKISLSNQETKEILTRPIEILKAKPFLSITDTCKLLGISRRTVYRMMERGEIGAGKAGKRTIIQRTDIDNLFTKS